MTFSRFDPLLSKMIEGEERPAKEGRTSGAAATQDYAAVRTSPPAKALSDSTNATPPAAVFATGLPR